MAIQIIQIYGKQLNRFQLQYLQQVDLCHNQNAE